VAATKERLDRLELRVTEHDREVRQIREILRDTARIMRGFAGAQREIQQSLKDLQNSLKRGANGHTKRKLNLE
jgi:hypothetical protein